MTKVERCAVRDVRFQSRRNHFSMFCLLSFFCAALPPFFCVPWNFRCQPFISTFWNRRARRHQIDARRPAHTTRESVGDIFASANVGSHVRIKMTTTSQQQRSSCKSCTAAAGNMVRSSERVRMEMEKMVRKKRVYKVCIIK
jgi:hypothetical protein